MKILIAPDSYKGSATSQEVAECIELGIKKVIPDAETIKLPIADGGEGTLETLMNTLNGSIREVLVTSPLGKKITSKYGIADNVAVIEMALASGLLLVEEEKRDPLKTTTYGTGELIKDAVLQGCSKIVIGIGGSATNDGGLGCAQALGYSFIDKRGNEVGFGGRELERISHIDTSNVINGLNEVEVIVACDVTNVLCGIDGASYVYGKQKGATTESIERLDKGLLHFSQIVKNTLGIDVLNIKGSGAAGGLGAGLLAFCDAKLQKGIDIVLDLVDIDSYLKAVDLVITGEGQIDGQSIFGKLPIGVSKRAKEYGVPVIVIAGSIGEGIDNIYDNNISSVISIMDSPMNLEEATRNVKQLLINSTERVVRLIMLGNQINL